MGRKTNITRLKLRILFDVMNSKSKVAEQTDHVKINGKRNKRKINVVD